jgi:hypothetical protein
MKDLNINCSGKRRNGLEAETLIKLQPEVQELQGL